MVCSTFFYQCMPGDVRACQDGLEHLFHVCPFDREGGGDLSNLGNAHIELTHFKKGLPFPKNIPPFPQYWGREKACNDGLEHFFCTKSAKASKLEFQNPGKTAMYRAGVESKRGKEVANKKALIRCLTFN